VLVSVIRRVRVQVSVSVGGVNVSVGSVSVLSGRGVASAVEVVLAELVVGPRVVGKEGSLGVSDVSVDRAASPAAGLGSVEGRGAERSGSAAEASAFEVVRDSVVIEVSAVDASGGESGVISVFDDGSARVISLEGSSSGIEGRFGDDRAVSGVISGGDTGVNRSSLSDGLGLSSSVSSINSVVGVVVGEIRVVQSVVSVRDGVTEESLLVVDGVMIPVRSGRGGVNGGGGVDVGGRRASSPRVVSGSVPRLAHCSSF